MSHYRFISMLIGLGVLSACNDPDEHRVSAQNDNGIDLSMSVDGGNDGANTKVSIRLPSLKLDNPDVDIDGVKLYPGARVTGVDISGEDGQSEGGMTIRFISDAAPDEIRDYYLGAFMAKGLTATVTRGGIAGTDHDGKPFRIDLVAQDGAAGTRGTVHVGNKSG
ncbi:MAG TPA: DUF4230 domain-containing protein [Sphingobium sp.]